MIEFFDIYFFFFSSRRRHTRFDCDWSSDVCSSDLVVPVDDAGAQRAVGLVQRDDGRALAGQADGGDVVSEAAEVAGQGREGGQGGALPAAGVLLGAGLARQVGRVGAADLG